MTSSKKTITLIGFLLFLMLFTTAPALALSPTVGRVVAVRGKVTAKNKNSINRPLKIKSEIYLNDIIQTANGRIQIIFKDNTIVTLGKSSKLEIEKYLWEAGNKKSGMEINIKEGSFRIMGGSIVKTAPENFKTNTPSGTIGIRGSIFAGLVKDSSLSVFFQGGKGIYVRNEFGEVEIRIPNQFTQVIGASAPKKPQQADAKALEELENALASYTPEEEDTGTSDTGSQPAKQEDTSGDADEGGTDATDTTNDDEGTGSKDTKTDKSGTDVAETGAATSPQAPTGTTTPIETSTTDAAQVTLLSNLGSSDDPQEPQPDDPQEPQPNDPQEPQPDDPQEPQPDDPQEPQPDDPQEPQPDDPQEPQSDDPGSSDTDNIITLALAQLGLPMDISASTEVPSSGIWEYKGKLEDQIESEPLEDIKATVNWSNRRILIGTDKDSGTDSHFGHGFGYGTISSTGKIENLTVLGSDAEPSDGTIFALTGSQTYGQFYGASAEGFAILMEGNNYNLQNASDKEFWQENAYAAFVSTKSDTTCVSSLWNGFFIGISEDMSQPELNRRIFRNTESNEFSFETDSASGTWSGEISGRDFYGSWSLLSSITIGGSTSEVTKSVYIDDELFAAELSGNNVIVTAESSSGLKDYGNFIVVCRDEPLSSHTQWGYWEAAYIDPTTEKNYHIHMPGSLWVAGKQTAASSVRPLLNTGFLAEYNGRAEGVMIENGFINKLYDGKAHLVLNFSFNAPSPVSGTISFTDHTLTVVSSYPSITDSGFSADIVGANDSRHVNGAFFGPDMDSIGGNFNAIIGTREYHGIFGGDRQ